MNIYNEITTISFQEFKKIRNISKLMMFAGAVNTTMMIFNMVNYRSEVIDPTTIAWICALNNAQFMFNIIMLVIGIIGMVMFASMNHGSNVKQCYKLWCDEHEYAPYNAYKR